MPNLSGGGEERGSGSRMGWVRGGNEEDDQRGVNVRGQGFQEWISGSRKAFPRAKASRFSNSSAVSGEQSVSLDGPLPTPDRTPTSRFLHPVRGRLQGKRREGC